jgi:hypothetical protein
MERIKTMLATMIGLVVEMLKRRSEVRKAS